MFRTVSGRDGGGRPEVTIFIEGEAVRVPEGETVAAAVLAYGLESVRTTPVSGKPRLPYCLMGICFDCLMEIDGVPNSQACMTRVKEGMRVERQTGARHILEA